MKETTRGTAGGLSHPLSDHPPFSSLASSAPRGHNAAFPGPSQTVLDAALLPDAPVSGPRWDSSASSTGFPVSAQGQGEEESSCASPGKGVSPHSIAACIPESSLRPSGYLVVGGTPVVQ